MNRLAFTAHVLGLAVVLTFLSRAPLLSAAEPQDRSDHKLSHEDVSALLLRQTQEFSEAGKTGNKAVMEKYLDPQVIFFNEMGEQATKKEIVEGTKPPPASTPVQTIKTTDWACKIYGDIAVASFVDVLQPGTPQEAKFRSVETWRKAGDAWRMIGSETLTIPQDPETVALAAPTLDDYTGAYEASVGMKFTFTRKGEALYASLNGGPESEQKAQARDIVFTPGRGQTPKVFQRGENGKVTGFIYLRGKNSIVFNRVS